jgi:RNA polymerase sigma-70 factor, ECF subfamily
MLDRFPKMGNRVLTFRDRLFWSVLNTTVRLIMNQAAIARLRIPVPSAWVKGPREDTPAPAEVAEQADEGLLQMAGQGSREALSILFRRHAAQIWSIGRRVLRDPAEAEDLVQDVFLYIYGKARLYDSCKGPARSWIIQVTYTQAFQRRRKLRSHGLYELSYADSPTKSVETTERKPAIYDDTVEGLFGRNGWKQIVEELTEDQRETLRLHFFEGHTFTEIAQILGQSCANVRNHHYRGLEKIRRHLAIRKVSKR